MMSDDICCSVMTLGLMCLVVKVKYHPRLHCFAVESLFSVCFMLTILVVLYVYRLCVLRGALCHSLAKTPVRFKVLSGVTSKLVCDRAGCGCFHQDLTNNKMSLSCTNPERSTERAV